MREHKLLSDYELDSHVIDVSDLHFEKQDMETRNQQIVWKRCKRQWARVWGQSSREGSGS
jgi:hypothetical protein